MLQLIGSFCQGDAAAAFHLRPPSIDNSADLFACMEEELGISFRHKSMKAGSKKEIWLLFNDTQQLHGDKHHSFWEAVVKTQTVQPFPTDMTVIAVIVAMHCLVMLDLPVCLKDVKRVDPEMLTLSKEEAFAIFQACSVCPQWLDLAEKLYCLGSGRAGVLAAGLQCVSSLLLNFEKTQDKKP